MIVSAEWTYRNLSLFLTTIKRPCSPLKINTAYLSQAWIIHCSSGFKSRRMAKQHLPRNEDWFRNSQLILKAKQSKAQLLNSLSIFSHPPSKPHPQWKFLELENQHIETISLISDESRTLYNRIYLGFIYPFLSHIYNPVMMTWKLSILHMIKTVLPVLLQAVKSNKD